MALFSLIVWFSIWQVLCVIYQTPSVLLPNYFIFTLHC